MSVEEIECDRMMLTERWKDVSSVPGMQKMHFFEVVETNVVNHSVHSSCDEAATHYFVPRPKKQACEVSSPPVLEKVTIEKEKYYAVFFDKKFYIGRVVAKPVFGQVEMKFLHRINNTEFDWPARDDVAKVKEHFLFCGPLNLSGNRPFKIANMGKVQSLYERMKKST